MHSLGKIGSRGVMAVRAAALALALLPLFTTGSLLAQLPPPEPTRPHFEERPFGPVPPPTPTPSPKRILEEPKKPIPRSWIIGGAIVAVLAVAGLAYSGYRAWRSSNLFDRQYRFPKGDPAVVRFGGNKCGGLMASVSFDRARAPAAAAPAESKAKDA